MIKHSVLLVAALVLVFACALVARGLVHAPPPAAQPITRVNLMTAAGAAVFGAQWRYSDVKIIQAESASPSGAPIITYDIEPHAGAAGFDDSRWEVIAADTLGERRAGGKVCFNWYRITLTMPARAGDVDVSGSTAVLSVTVDDYAEVWVNGQLPRALDGPNPNLVQGFNKPNRLSIAENLKPGDKVEVAIFGINGPISAAPANYIWFREANVEFLRP
jgi:hypothetical protein